MKQTSWRSGPRCLHPRDDDPRNFDSDDNDVTKLHPIAELWVLPKIPSGVACRLGPSHQPVHSPDSLTEQAEGLVEVAEDLGAEVEAWQ
jgi:hypothetical protein